MREKEAMTSTLRWRYLFGCLSFFLLYTTCAGLNQEFRFGATLLSFPEARPDFRLSILPNTTTLPSSAILSLSVQLNYISEITPSNTTVVSYLLSPSATSNDTANFTSSAPATTSFNNVTTSSLNFTSTLPNTATLHIRNLFNDRQDTYNQSVGSNLVSFQIARESNRVVINVSNWPFADPSNLLRIGWTVQTSQAIRSEGQTKLNTNNSLIYRKGYNTADSQADIYFGLYVEDGTILGGSNVSVTTATTQNAELFTVTLQGGQTQYIYDPMFTIVWNPQPTSSNDDDDDDWVPIYNSIGAAVPLVFLLIACIIAILIGIGGLIETIDHRIRVARAKNQ